jgi:hypothetical protein
MKEKFKIIVGILTAISLTIKAALPYVLKGIFGAFALVFLVTLFKNRHTLLSEQDALNFDLSDLIWFGAGLSCALLLLNDPAYIILVGIATIFRRFFKAQPSMAELFNN